jgi:hypothetical protein
MSNNVSTYQRGVLTGAQLIHRLNQMAAGVAKHGAEPGFPNFFATNNLAAKVTMVATAVLEANAAKADERAKAIAMKQESAEVRDLYNRGIAAIESFYGPDNPTLREFGIRARKGPDSPHVRGAAKGGHTKKARKAASASSASTGGGSSTTNTANQSVGGNHA